MLGIIAAIGLAMAGGDDRPEAAAVDLQPAASFSGQIVLGTREQVLLAGSYGLSDREAGEAVTTGTLFDIGSLTKQVTAAGVLRLVQDGQVSLDETLSVFFQDIPPEFAERSVHEVLTHFAGLPQYSGEDYDLLDRDGFDEWLMQAASSEAEAGRFHYSNPGYSILARIIEMRSGQDFEAYLHEALFEPAGIEAMGYTGLPSEVPEAVGYYGGEAMGRPREQAWLPDGPSWNLRGNGGLLASAETLYHWVVALTGGSVLDAEHTVMLFQPHVVRDAERARSYGYGWNVDTSGSTVRINHSGGNMVFVAFAEWWPESDCFFTITSNAYDESGFSELVADVRAVLADYPQCAGG
ncbi:serine hydrolase domain-containing protein [Hyphobacterium sp. HN65]|uniref:Serine hydrolase domain-containing protein n=1 Tax=Hyphobacterium lacteum TaxID=3116575 RepID=A0ABU7LN36_9PROT|nr:serine hydrolase domain-containing protein [Hyphobacterium sp. HN65]MEE2525330.1 serine hydrolase domain-containing protein [Hyphobacterium sp. HN65]